MLNTSAPIYTTFGMRNIVTCATVYNTATITTTTTTTPTTTTTTTTPDVEHKCAYL